MLKWVHTAGSSFTRAEIVEKQSYPSGSISYYYLFTGNNINGKYFFRRRQKFIAGKNLLSSIKSIDFKESLISRFSLYTNPSNGIVGIKFDKYKMEKILVLIANAFGQTIVNKEIKIIDGNNRQIGALQRACIWIKMTMEQVGSPELINFSLNDLLGGRGWWLVKGALVRGPLFLLKSQ
ncbi:MAG: type sorting protein [Chitinophagaceae bacterium]|nr:type sorting protein [Chitinophagaceae bacterium]